MAQVGLSKSKYAAVSANRSTQPIANARNSYGSRSIAQTKRLLTHKQIPAWR